MAPKIFLTGATGYIGGDVLYELYSKHSDWTYTALVRTEEKAESVKKAFPNINFAYGNLDDSDLIKEQASKADIVIHTADASDHEGAARAIAAGLAEGHSKEHPGYWLHTSGTGILTYRDSEADRYGEPDDKIYNDLDGVDELVGLPDQAFHRNVDKVVLEAGSKDTDAVKTAVLCPPTIYGPGRGPGGQRSRQAPTLAECTLKRGKAPVIGKGQARWNQLHVHDLAQLFCLLAEAAAAGKDQEGMWGPKGYYIVEHGEFAWGDLAKLMAKVAAEKGYIKSAETDSMNKDEAWEVADFQALSWGMNSRAKSGRAQKMVGWKPTMPSLEDTVPDLMENEHQRLQKS